MVRGHKFESPLNQPVRWNGSDVPIPRWRHLAVTVASDLKVHVYQDGVSVSPNESFLAGATPISGTLALGRREKVDNVQPQFNGLIDDAFLYSRVLNASEIAALAADHPPAGAVASMTFDNWERQPAPPARLVEISKERNAAVDRTKFLTPTIVFNRLPFPDGEVWRVIQAWNNGGGSHRGQASFSIDLAWIKESDVAAHVNTPQAETEGRPVVAVLSTTVDVSLGTGAPCTSNYVRLHVGSDSFAIYHHLLNGVALKPGDTIAEGGQIGLAADTGLVDGSECTPVPGCCHRSRSDHLHFAVAAGVPRPYVFRQFEVSTDRGRTWRTVSNGFPYREQWIRSVSNPAQNR